MKIEVVTLLILLAPGAAVAQTVYKCKAADGSAVYAQQPCGKDAEERVVKAPQSSADEQTQSHFAAMSRTAAVARVQNSARTCIANAESNAWRPANEAIRAHERRIAALNADIRRANNNLAGATWEAGMRQEIGGLQQAIATERSNAQTLASSGRQQCEDERRRAEQAIAAEAEKSID